MDEKELAVYLQRVARRVRELATEAAQETQEELYEAALRMSSGNYSLWLLRRMGHPYAQRHAINRRFGARYRGAPSVPYGDAGIINEQSGKFKAAWKKDGPTVTEKGVEVGLKNDSAHAVFINLSGSSQSSMIRRPIQSRLEALGRKLWRQKLAAAIAKAAEG